jgi:HSP20 family protein
MLYRSLTRSYAYWRPGFVWHARPTRRLITHQREFDRLWHEMDRQFANWPTRWNGGHGYPATNVWTNEDGAVVSAELPGVAPEDIDISVVNDSLTVSGTRKSEGAAGATYIRRERGHGEFTRTFQLPFQIQGDQVKADFDKGVLHITLPRAEEDKPKKIEVKVTTQPANNLDEVML